MADGPLITTDAPLAEEQNPQEFVRHWIGEIDRSEKFFAKWRERSKKIIERFRDVRGDDGSALNQTQPTRRYNILWANVKLLQPVLYSRMPEPEVTRRHKDKDQVARVACEILKRALRYDMERDDFNATMTAARDDYLLPGRGTAWVHYLPKFADETVTPDVLWFDDERSAEEEAKQLGVADVLYSEEQDKWYVQPDPFRPVADEFAPTEHVLWNEFLHEVTEKWERVSWVSRIHKLKITEARDWFGDVADEIACDDVADGVNVPKGGINALADSQKRMRVYEIWDKKTKTVQWISRGYKDAPIARVYDPLGLSKFFPCPKPLYATITTDSLEPLPDYVMYQDQAAEIDRLTHRIALLQSAIRVIGVYNSQAAELRNLLGDVATNQMIPVTNWMAFADKGGIANQIDWFPIDKIVQALDQLYKARETVKQEMYEITGLSDILRGSTDPRETLGAQQLKGNYASKRIVDRQQDVANFARDLIEIKAEIICNKFDSGRLRLQSGYDVMLGIKPEDKEQVWADAVALLQNELLRGFRVDVESDSTVQPNAEQDRAQRMEFVAAVSGFLREAAPAAMQFEGLGPLLAETLLFAVRGWNSASGMEAILEDALDRMNEASREATQNQPPSEAEIKQQTEMQKLQQAQAEAQTQAQIERERIASDERVKMAQIDFERWKSSEDWKYKGWELSIREREVAVKEHEARTEASAVAAETALGAAQAMNGQAPGAINGAG